MGRHFFKAIRNNVKYWYLHLLSGIILIAIGIWTFAHPAESYAALAFIFAVSLIGSGLFESIFAISNRDVLDNWGWQLVSGLISFAVGILLLIKPEISMITLAFYIGFVVLFRSMQAMGIALDLRNYGVDSWGGLMALAVLGILLAIIFLWNPDFAGLSAVVLTGIIFILAGITSIVISLKLKKLHDFPDKVDDEIKKRFKEAEKEVLEALDKS